MAGCPGSVVLITSVAAANSGTASGTATATPAAPAATPPTPATNSLGAAPAGAPAPTPADTPAARGKYLADAGNCVSCHTPPGGAAFAGGLGFTTPLGTIYSSNITPDNETGIGQWTAADLRRAMHEGIGRGGYHLFPAFPYTSFTKVTDEDVNAIYAYLRTLPPVRHTPPANSLLFRLRWGMSLWNWLFFKPGRFQPDTRQSAEWNRGAYLVDGLGHCDACHSPRNLFLAEIASRNYAGGNLTDRVIDNQMRRWSAVNLTSAHSGLAAWSVDNLTRYLKNGFSPRAGTFGPMNEVIVNSLHNLTSDDIHAMATYLKSLPTRDENSTTVPSDAVSAGAGIYKDRCDECHGSSGRGGLFNGPPLAGSAVVQDADPATLINVMLYGPTLPKGISFGGWETMKPYRDVLNDNEIAAVANYIRGSWDNRAPPITASDVAKQR
jgi:mono/diheme cytochrome c family protein